MPKIANIEIGKRMHEECLRLFPSVKEMVPGMGCSKDVFYKWAEGCAPSAMNLQRLALCGGDVVYVLTGRRSNAMSKV